MTEITEKNVWLKVLPAEEKPERLIDPVAFFAAFILAPIFFAAAFFWVLLIPVVGLFLGAPAYVFLAMPILLMWMRRRAITKQDAMKLGLLIHVIPVGLIGLAMLIAPDLFPRDAASQLSIYLILGLFHAPCWCGLFATFYNRWERDFYNQTV
jgi:hypothetical protein